MYVETAGQYDVTLTSVENENTTKIGIKIIVLALLQTKNVQLPYRYKINFIFIGKNSIHLSIK